MWPVNDQSGTVQAGVWAGAVGVQGLYQIAEESPEAAAQKQRLSERGNSNAQDIAHILEVTETELL